MNWPVAGLPVANVEKTQLHSNSLRLIEADAKPWTLLHC
jgi:hypothetical protein